MTLNVDALRRICSCTETNKPVIFKIGRKIIYLTNPIRITIGNNPFDGRRINIGLTDKKDEAVLSHDLVKAINDCIADTGASYYTEITIGNNDYSLPDNHISETETALIIENEAPEFNTMAEIYSILQDSDIRDGRGWLNMEHDYNTILITDKFGREFSVIINYKH